MTRPPAPALSDAEAATVARFDAAPVPPEVVEARETVERVARAMFERPLAESASASWHEVSEGIRQTFRADARAAIAAMPPTADAEKRAAEELRAMAAELSDSDQYVEIALGGAAYVQTWLRDHADALDPS